MPNPSLMLFISALLQLASFGLLLFLGKRMGTPLAGWVATAFMLLSFALGLAGMIAWFNQGQYLGVDWGPGKNPIDLSYKWIPAGRGLSQDHPGFLDVDIYVDSLTIALFNMVCLVSLLVHFFSIGYMAEDKRFPRFFTYLSLFCFSMLGLLLAGTLVQLFIFWELVGLCSYLLIGFWYEKRSAARAALKAVVVNRIGDTGFIAGMGMLFYFLGNITLLDMVRWLGGGTTADIHLANGMTVSTGALTAIGILLFVGAMAKSAQFPLHVWLPDAMEGPTPISALIHAATMVAAGVYLVGRIFPILTPDARLFVAVIGTITIALGSLVAMVQSDVKRVLAYSTISQLGYMMLAMGIGSWIGGLFHLITHALIKALLFLSAGSVIRAADHEQELPRLGGMLTRIPVTAVAFGIGVLSIAGMPFFAGYYSKDIILAHAQQFADLAHSNGLSEWYRAFYWVPLGAAFLTAFYMTRCWMLIFWRRTDGSAVEKSGEAIPEPAVMRLSLVALAVLSIVAGSQFLGVKNLLQQSQIETRNNSVSQGMTDTSGLWQSWPADSVEAPTAALWALAGGVGLAVLIYWRGYSVANVLMKIPPLRWIHRWLYEEMGINQLGEAVVVAFTMAFAAICAAMDRWVIDGLSNLVAWLARQFASAVRWNDQHIIDGAATEAANYAGDLGAAVRMAQSGRIRMYIMLVMAVLAISLAGVVMVIWIEG